MPNSTLLKRLKLLKFPKLLRLPVVFLFSLLPFYFLLLPFAFAQSTSVDVAYVYDIADQDALDGDLLILDKSKGIVRATEPLDHRIFGVLQAKPLLVYKRVDNSGQPVVRNGVAEVNVSTINGAIKPGDYITTSPMAGKGEKAIQSGYVIGVALSSFEEKDGQQIDFKLNDKSPVQKVSVGKISVAVNIEYADITTTRFNSRLFDNFNSALSQNIQDPNRFVQVMRYLAAALCVLISVLAGFFTFSRSIPKSIEAIGRNPLAKNAIMFSIILNIALTLVVAGIGVFVAFLILRI